MSGEVLLRQGIQKIGLQLNERQIASLLDFVVLLQKWNKVYNLTSIRSTKEIITHHIFDSLAAVIPLRSYLRKQQSERTSNIHKTISLLDVGSGAGLPGVVFALCCPEIEVCCVEAVGKKTAFINQVALTIGLDNLEVINARIEIINRSFDIITCRAFSSLSKFIYLTHRNLAPCGVWFAMKSSSVEEEIKALPSGVYAFHVEQLIVPELNARRCIVWICLKNNRVLKVYSNGKNFLY